MTPETMFGFGYKTAWLAVRDTPAEAVLAALGARDPRPVAWFEGVDRSYANDDLLVATPPLPGARDAAWTLITGRWLLLHEADVDPAALSARLHTEVQYFATYRVVELHHWQRAVDGILVRAFRYVGESGEVTAWRGDPDGTELAIGLPPALTPERTVIIGEADVLRLAGTWSVDPSSLGGRPAAGPLQLAGAPPPGP